MWWNQHTSRLHSNNHSLETCYYLIQESKKSWSDFCLWKYETTNKGWYRDSIQWQCNRWALPIELVDSAEKIVECRRKLILGCPWWWLLSSEMLLQSYRKRNDSFWPVNKVPIRASANIVEFNQVSLICHCSTSFQNFC